MRIEPKRCNRSRQKNDAITFPATQRLQTFTSDRLMHLYHPVTRLRQWCYIFWSFDKSAIRRS